jgi:EpsD family peptidyl-prolyl cis-trans isomerase
LASCSRSEPERYARVAAKVNGEEISVPRFQWLRARAEVVPVQNVDPGRLMDGLIDRVLFAQKAAKLELDRHGVVPVAIEEARTEILALAYIENMLRHTRADASEVKAFYLDHPELFEQRRIFRVFELAVILPPRHIGVLKERAKRARGLHEIAEWLKSQELAFNVGGVTKPSEQIGSELLTSLTQMKDGEIQVIEVQGGASVLQLVQSEAAPLTLETAAPMIEELLRARKREEIAAQESKYLRSVASIDYLIDLGQPSRASQVSQVPAAVEPPALY